MNIVKRTISVAAALLSVIAAFAQSQTVSGYVASADGPETGVIVFEKSNSSNATMTDLDGRYTITVKGSDPVIVFSMVGFKDREERVAGRKTVDVILETDQTLLEEVVVIGYGAQNKDAIVGSVSQITSKDLLKAPTTNVTGMLAGRLAGLTSIQKSGTPGDDAASILVRGYTTFNGSGPLFIVDGVERSMNYLNPNDIASISVLKDAASAAIYGVRGGNGVILITTKSGATGSTKIQYDGSATFTRNTAMPEFCNAEQYIYYHNKAREMDGLDPLWTPEVISWMKDKGIYAETDWQKEIYNDFGFQHQHNISATGGSEKVKYFTSLGLMDQDGILKSTDFKRYNVRSNIDAKIVDGLSLNLNLAANHSVRNLPGYSIAPVAEFSPITQAYYALPILATTYDGLALGYNHGTYVRTPLAALTESGYNNQRRYNLEGSAKLEYDFAKIDFLKGLKASIFAAYNYSFTADNNFMHSFNLYKFTVETLSLDPAVSMGISKNSYSKSASYGWNMTVRPQIDYNRSFGLHTVGFTGFFERYKSYSDTMTSFKEGYYIDDPVDMNLGMTTSGSAPSGSHAYSGFASFAGRLNYSYDAKYLAELTARADASYKFAPENRWGFFPSLALGWVISKEDFFSGLSDKVNFLKLKASAGLLGSDDTSAYLYLQTYNIATNTIILGGAAQSSFYSSGYVYDNLTWSQTETFNVGFETKLFSNKLSIDGDFFYKYTNRILEQDSTGTYSPSLGGNYPTWMNTGKMDNRGFELVVRHDNWYASGWNYTLTGMVSYSHNRVLSRRIIDDHPSYRAILGQPIGSYYGFHATGLYQTQQEVDAAPTAPSGYIELGAIKYQDVNGDGKITSQYDYVKIGRSSTPEMTFSLNGDVGYKNWSLSVLLQGATLCNYMLSGAYNNTTDNTMFTRAFYGNGNSVLYLVEDAWTPENTDARYPRLTSKTNANNAWASDWWVIDGSYLRVKNVQLTYKVPARALGMGNAIQGMSVYVAGTNLLTLSHFKYLDPENPGVSNGYYPQQKTYSVGVNVSF